MLGFYSESSSDPLLNWLASLAGQHIHFFPNPGNAGDGFIAHATYELFDRFGISFTSYSQTETAAGEPVVIGGGGNLIEGRYTDAATVIARHCDRQMVVLPHTMLGYADLIAAASKRLTLFLRDPVSYSLALSHGACPERTHLSHDMVFFLDQAQLGPFNRLGSGILRALRTDGESAQAVPLHPSNLDLSLSWNGDRWKDRAFAKFSTYTLASYIAQFEWVLTDRLHIAILAAMLGKRVTLLPNAYFKVRAIYEHSMQSRFPNVTFVNTLPTADHDPQSQRDNARLEIEVGRREEAERTLQLMQENIGKREEDLERLNGRIELLVQENILVTCQKETLGAELKKMQWERAAVTGQKEILETKMNKMQQELDVVTDQKETLQTDLNNLQQEWAIQKDELRQCAAIITAMRCSTSWRVTSPLRGVALFFRKREAR